MSKREDIQNDMAQFLEDVGLNEVYGVLTGLDTLDNGRKVRTVTFCRARSLDGQVVIYSESFVQVVTNREREVFTSPEDAKAWIKAKYVDFDQVAADAIPRK